MNLPVSEIFSELEHALAKDNAIVVAPPGAGKSTALPLFLLSLARYSQGAGKKIIMLQPRRVAARSIAHFLSKSLNETVGQTVGYRIRGEHKVSKTTRLEIVTEGILTRMLQSSPELADVGLIIFDEFHERSIHADFSLALCIEVQQALRDDLRLLVMSATLNAESLQSLLPKAPVLKSEGRSFPVDIHYVGERESLSTLQMKAQAKKRTASVGAISVERICRLILEVFDKHSKDFLVFLPGVAEINKAARMLADGLGDTVSIHPLFSDLNKAQQESALAPSPLNKRKIVLATNIAETSLTIEGIEVVIDSGLEKNAVFDLKQGITQIKLQKISQASATQRAGRAGRLMAGTCYRMWPKEQQERLAKQSIPQILSSDLSGILMESIVWGSKIEDLALLDYPSEAQIAQAMSKMRQLQLINADKKLTMVGKQVHKLATDINIASMLLHSSQLSAAHQSMACGVAAILENKDPLAPTKHVEFAARIKFLIAQRSHPIWQHIKQWHQKLGITEALSSQPWPIDDLGLVIAFGFTQWIAKNQGRGRFLLANGKGATLGHSNRLNEPYKDQAFQDSAHDMNLEPWLAVCHMQITHGNNDTALIRYAQPIELTSLKKHFGNMFVRDELLEWDDEKQRISANQTEFFANIQIAKSPLVKPSGARLIEVWQDVLRNKFLPDAQNKQISLDSVLDKRSQQLLIRARLARQHLVKHAAKLMINDLSTEYLIASLDEWLLPYLEGKSTWQQFLDLPFYQLLSQILGYQQQQMLNELLPESIEIPTGRNAMLDYQHNGQVRLSVRMQELYGWQAHPSLLHGELALTCELLSPAQRPLQTTQDLPGFWSGSYQDIKKEMKGRYPKHYWPDEPASAKATTTTKKNSGM